MLTRRRPTRFLLPTAMILSLAVSPVTATIHRVKADAAGLNNGTSWPNAFRELQSALAVAQPGDEIWVAAGKYRPDYDVAGGTHTQDRLATFQLISGVEIYGGFAGVEMNRNQRDPLRFTSVLSGDLNDDDATGGDYSENSFHVVSGSGTDDTAVLDGFTITGGNADGAMPGFDSGAGLLVAGLNSSPIIRGCRFSRNRAVRNGGGAFGSTSNPRFFSCVFTENSATGELGRGGALAFISASDTSVVNCRFVANSSAFSGGAFFARASTITLAHCTFTANTATGSLGGGAIHSQEADTTLSHCVLWRDLAREAREIRLTGGSIAVLYTNIEGGEAAVMALPVPPATITWDADTNLDEDPFLTPDGHLRSISPCINAGDPAFPSDGAEPDADGDMRVLGGRVDIGADEFGDADADGLPGWWERLYFGSPLAAGPENDPDMDGADNLREYELYSSHPVTPPIHVCDACDPAPDGSLAHPFATIQDGLDAAADGDTVVVRASMNPGVTTVYSGPGNFNLDYHNRSILVRKIGPGPAVIDCGGEGRSVEPASVGSIFASLEGFRIVNAVGNGGGAFDLSRTRLVLVDCSIENSTSPDGVGGLRGSLSTLTFGGLTLGTGNSPPAGRVEDSVVRLGGPLHLVDGEFQSAAGGFEGPGPLILDAGTFFVAQTHPMPTALRTNVVGAGQVTVEPGTRLSLESQAVVDLAVPPNSGCAADPASCGKVVAQGELVLEGTAVVKGANLDVKTLRIQGLSRITDSTVRLRQVLDGFSGELTMDQGAIVSGNTIISEGDRYLDLDPDPQDPNPGVFGNTFEVEVTPVPSETGMLLELRMQDFDCPPMSDCRSDAFELPASSNSQGYADPWVLEQLEILPGGKLNLTNQQGLVFQDESITTPETLYVKTLKMHPRSLLNLGLQRLYYQKLVNHLDAEIDRSDLRPMNSVILSVPLTGFSLTIIAMEDDTEFDVRVQTRIRDDADQQPCQCEGLCEDEPQDVTTCLEGQVHRLPDEGVMEMRTQAPNREQAASSVAARGSFVRAGSEEVVVNFEYLFREAAADTELIVYMSDDPSIGEDMVELGRITAPAAGRPGAVGENEFGVFSGIFPRGTLRFVRGTYIELELRGTGARVWIDNWDPLITCSTTCGDLNKAGGVIAEDFMILVAESGQRLEDQNEWCLDLSKDGFVDLHDFLLWNPTFDHLCYEPESASAEALASSEPLNGTGGDLASLLVAGRSTDPALFEPESIFPFSRDGVCQGNSAHLPAGGTHSESNGRLIVDRDGNVYQFSPHQSVSPGSAGLVWLKDLSRIDDDQLVVRETTKIDGDTIYVGINDAVEDPLPLVDAVFDPVDPLVVYVVPILVVPSAGGDPYRAAARLRLDSPPTGDFEIEQVFVPVATSGATKNLPREVELDRTGRYLFVTSSYAARSSETQLKDDYIFVYDAATGALQKEVALHDPLDPSGLIEPIHSPSSLLVSQLQNTLYLTSTVDEAPTVYRFSFVAGETFSLDYEDKLDLGFASRDVGEFTASSSAGTAAVELSWTPPTLSGFDAVRIQRGVSVDWPKGTTYGTTVYEGSGTSFTDTDVEIDDEYCYRIYAHYGDTNEYSNGLYAQAVAGTDSMAVDQPDAGLTALAEHPYSGRLLAIGYTAPSFAPDHPVDDPVFKENSDQFRVYTLPVRAEITWPAGQPAATAVVNAEVISCHDLALPISAVYLPTVPSDFDGDRDVDADDVAALAACAMGPEVVLTDPACAPTDLDGDGDTDSTDFALLQRCVSGPGVAARVGCGE